MAEEGSRGQADSARPDSPPEGAVSSRAGRAGAASSLVPVAPKGSQATDALAAGEARRVQVCREGSGPPERGVRDSAAMAVREMRVLRVMVLRELAAAAEEEEGRPARAEGLARRDLELAAPDGWPHSVRQAAAGEGEVRMGGCSTASRSAGAEQEAGEEAHSKSAAGEGEQRDDREEPAGRGAEQRAVSKVVPEMHEPAQEELNVAQEVS